jgi:hypothetical protein
LCTAHWHGNLQLIIRFTQFTQSGHEACICRIALGDAMGLYVSLGWLGQCFIGGRSVVARFLFMLAMENPSCGQQSFESGGIEGGALAHAEIASIAGWSSPKKRPRRH